MEDNIKITLTEMLCKAVGCINRDQTRYCSVAAVHECDNRFHCIRASYFLLVLVFWVVVRPMFQNNILPPFAGAKDRDSIAPVNMEVMYSSKTLISTCRFTSALQPRKSVLTSSLLSETEISCRQFLDLLSNCQPLKKIPYNEIVS